MKDGGLLLTANDERRIEVLLQIEAGLLAVAERGKLQRFEQDGPARS